MKILWLKQRFHPEPSPLRGLNFAKAIRSRGHDIEIVTGYPYYPTRNVYDGYEQRLYGRESVDEIVVHRNMSVVGHDSNPLRRALAYTTLPLTSGVNVWRRNLGADLVITTLGPATYAYAAQKISNHLRCPLVLDVQDLWPESLRASGMLAPGIPTGWIHKRMKPIYEAADLILCLSDGARELLVDRGAMGERVRTVLNWAPEIEFGKEEIQGSGFDTDQPYFVYAGALGPLQGVNVMIDALRALPDQALLVLGAGRDENELRRQADDLQHRVKFLGQQSPAMTRAVVSRARAALLHLAPSPLDGSAIPSKMASYLAAGVPLVTAAGGETARLARRVGAGPICDPNDAGQLERAMKSVLSASESQVQTWCRNGREFAEQELSFTTTMDRIVEMLEMTVEARLH